MKTSTIVIWAVVLIIIAAGIWYFLSPGFQSSYQAGTTATSSEQASTTNATGGTGTASGGTSTLRALATQGGNYTCDLNTTSNNGTQVRGTIYGAGGKSRLNLVSSYNGTDVTMHIIRTGGYSYTWVDGQTVGTKAAVTASSPVVQPTGGVITATDASTFASSCRPWATDATQFVLPTGITFR